MAYYCSSCEVGWWPYMYKQFNGCPTCGGGTRWNHEGASPEAMDLYSEALRTRHARDEAKARELAFELFCDEVEAHRWNDQLDELGALLEAEWRRETA